MKRKSNNIFMACISAVYIITVILYITALAVERHRGPVLEQERFSQITKDLSRSLLVNDPESVAFKDDILSALDQVQDIAAIQISTDGKLIFSYPVDAPAIALTTSPLVRSHSTALNAESGKKVTLTLSLYLLKPYSIFYWARIAFIIILTATLSCVLYMIFFAFKPGQDEADDYDYGPGDGITSDTELEAARTEEQDAGAGERTETVTTREEEEAPAAEKDVPEKEEPYAVTEPHADGRTEATVTAQEADNTIGDESQVSGAQGEEHPESTEESIGNTEEVPETSGSSSEENDVPQDTGAAPQGLYSPLTGFGWESYMIPRLDKELIRAAGSEQDLALLTLRIPGIDWRSESARKIASLIISTVRFEDLVFDYKTDGCSAILQGEDTDHAIQIAETLYGGIMPILHETDAQGKAYIGISTRSLRLISGSRLANESEQALIHALNDKDSPIIAFRVNPDKYRKFISESARA